MRPFKSIEDRYGVDADDYVPPAEHDNDFLPTERRTLYWWEALFAFLMPLVGLAMSVWRFGRGHIGPGIADLILCGIGWLVWAYVIYAGQIG